MSEKKSDNLHDHGDSPAIYLTIYLKVDHTCISVILVGVLFVFLVLQTDRLFYGALI